MSIPTIIVRAVWDEESSVWVATSDDVVGLAIEAPTPEELERKVLAAVSDLVDLNGIETDTATPLVQIVLEQGAVAPLPYGEGWKEVEALDAGDMDVRREALLTRLKSQPVLHVRRWTRDEIYDDEL